MNIMGVSTNWQQAVVGFVILFSVFYEYALNHIMVRFADKRGGKSAQAA